MFELSPHIDKNKIFLVNLSEIEGRLDPHPYHSERINTLKKLALLPNLEKLKNVVISKKVTTNNISNEDIYIGLENIESHTGIYIPTKEKKDVSSANIFKKGQILFPKLRPYLNKVYLAEFDGLCSTEFHVFTSKLVKPEYLAIYLRSNIVVSQTKHLMTGNTLPRLQTEDIENLPVPILPEEIQQQIICLYETAHKTKQQKEAEAERLLNSIDDYLLGELGITVPEKDNSLENRIFKVNFSEVTGNRFDCDYYQFYYKNIEKSIENCLYDITQIKNVVSFIGSGKTPASTDYSDTPTKFPIIKVGSYTDEFIDLNKVDYTTIKPTIYVEKGDIFILSAAHQAEYVGKQIKYLDDIPKQKTSFVGELICIRANPLLVNSAYLFSLLNLNIYKTLLNREKTGQTSHIYAKDIKHIYIPLPPIEKQNKIAEHIKAIREQAKQLKAEAKEVLEQAKQEVEKMILGEML